MEQKTELGMNVTGIDMAPLQGPEMLENSRIVPDAAGSAADAGAMRAEFVVEANPIGTVPLPGSVRGAIRSAADKLKGDRPEVLLDRLGQRLAFERSGTRLYDLFLDKCAASAADIPEGLLERARAIRDEEAKHARWVQQAIVSLGADPTALTPAADVTAVSSLGLFQLMADPRVTVSQSLEALLVAELTDNDAWAVLIDLARRSGKTELIERFETALVEEEQHLEQVRAWCAQFTLADVEGEPVRGAKRVA